MKRLFLSVALFGLAKLASAAPLVAEAPVKDYGTPVTVALSTSAFTKIPTSQTSGRMGVFIDAPSTNTAAVAGFFGNCTSTALATTIRPIAISPSTNSTYISLREDVCLWLISLHTATESIHYQEVMQ